MIFIVSGPGGVGKGTVVAELVSRDPSLSLSRSWTTRPRRPGEAADAYVFTDEHRFMARVAADGFLEWTRFPGSGHLYGTPDPDPHDDGDLLLEIELDGAQQVKAAHPGAVLILVTAPSRAAQEARLRARGDDDASVARRLEVGDAELELGRTLADEIVVNDTVEQACRDVADIIARRRKAS